MVKLLILGPAIGFAIGGVGSWLMTKIDAHMAIRREQQALFGVGLVLAAFSAATAAGGDGFLSAFAASLAVVLLNQNLCDCFMEYGEVTAEMAMLLAFVLFGAVLSGVLGSVDVVPALVLAGLVIFVIRPSILGGVLARARMSWRAHAFRTRSSYERDGAKIPGSARVLPDKIVDWAAECAADELVVSYCS